MTSKTVLPKDLKVVMGSEMERNWTQVRNTALNEIKTSEFNIIIQRELLKIAKAKILLEQKLFKRKNK